MSASPPPSGELVAVASGPADTLPAIVVSESAGSPSVAASPPRSSGASSSVPSGLPSVVVVLPPPDSTAPLSPSSSPSPSSTTTGATTATAGGSSPTAGKQAPMAGPGVVPMRSSTATRLSRAPVKMGEDGTTTEVVPAAPSDEPRRLNTTGSRSTTSPTLAPLSSKRRSASAGEGEEYILISTGNSLNDEGPPLPKPMSTMERLRSRAASVGEILSKKEVLGKKTISLIGSFTLNINNLCGPGMLVVPIVFQSAGWLPCTLALILFMILTSFSCTMLCEAMALIPGNKNFSKRIEFSTIVEKYYGKTWYFVCMSVYALSLQTLNIASILVSAQVMDQFFVYAFHKSFAFDVSHFKFVSTSNQAVPFDGDGFILTLGYMALLIPCMPLGFLNLDENVYMQYLSISVFLLIFGEFMVQFCFLPLDFSCFWKYKDVEGCAIPMIGNDLYTFVGAIMFSYTFVVTIPSWVNEKKETVSLNQGIWVPAVFCTFVYFSMGVLGAAAFPGVSDDILSSLASRAGASTFTKISVYLFSFGVIGLGIPLFEVMIRYNLYVGKIFGAYGSAFWGAVFPWCVAWLLYQGDGFAQFVTWSSLVINSFINFGVPMLLYRTARKKHKERMESLESRGLLNSTYGGDAAVEASSKGISDDTFDYTGMAVLPKCCRSYYRSRLFALILLIITVVLTVVAIAYQIVQNVEAAVQKNKNEI